MLESFIKLPSDKHICKIPAYRSCTVIELTIYNAQGTRCEMKLNQPKLRNYSQNSEKKHTSQCKIQRESHEELQ